MARLFLKTVSVVLCAFGWFPISVAQVASSCPPPPLPLPTISWTSTQKVEQMIGDWDWTCTLDEWLADKCKAHKTASQTFKNGGVLGNGNGYSFLYPYPPGVTPPELVFLFGDTIAQGNCNATQPTGWFPVTSGSLGLCVPVGNPNLDYQGGDTFAFSSSLSSADPLVLNFVLDPKKSTHKQPIPLLVKPTDCTSKDGCVKATDTLQAYNLECDQRVRHGGDDIPNSGVSVGGNLYMTVNTNSCVHCTLPTTTGSTCNNIGYEFCAVPGNKQCDPHGDDYSVLVRYDPAAKHPFQSVRVISHVDYASDTSWDPTKQALTVFPDTTGHFIFTSTHHVTPDMGLGFTQPMLLTFGVGHYREDNIYLSVDPEDHYEAGDQTQYLLGVQPGQDATDAVPMWTAPGESEPSGLPTKCSSPPCPVERSLYPVVVDNPECSSTAPKPSIGKLSVAYSPDLQLWLMTFSGGAKVPNDPTGAFNGIYFTYAAKPWGPWAPPQLIFNACTNPAPNQGYGSYIYYNFDKGCSSVTTSGPAGPAGVGQDVLTQTGEAFGPFMIEPYISYTPTTFVSGTLTIYFTMSTLNPYTVVKMRSDLQVTF